MVLNCRKSFKNTRCGKKLGNFHPRNSEKMSLENRQVGYVVYGKMRVKSQLDIFFEFWTGPIR